MSKLDFRDWFIITLIAEVVNALLYLAFKYHTDLIVGAICGAIPTILGLYHWFTLKDSKTQDAPPGGQ